MSEPRSNTTDHHTPGPWKEHAPNVDGTVDETYRRITAGVGFCHGRDEPGFQLTGYIRPADARLIAAAPELLALAKQYAHECANCSGCGFTVGDDGISGRGPDDIEPTRYSCEDCADIRAVIAKAEGQSNV